MARHPILQSLLYVLLLCHVLVGTAHPPPPSRHEQPEEDCNICGCSGCIIGNPQGKVSYVYENQVRINTCQKLKQEIIDNPPLSRALCQEELWKVAYQECACQRPQQYNNIRTSGACESIAKSWLYGSRIPMVSHVNHV